VPSAACSFAGEMTREVRSRAIVEAYSLVRAAPLAHWGAGLLPRRTRCLVTGVGDDRVGCHYSHMMKKWCVGCQEWVEPDKRRMELEREGGSGMERRPNPVVELCPQDDGTASGHLLVDAPPT
jgi:hypothetical protein